MRTATKGVIAAGAVLAAGIGGVAYASSRSSSSSSATEVAHPLATATVTTRDLVTYDETTATLGFTASFTVSAPVDGTVTKAPVSGDTVDAGTVVAEIDAEPVVALYGDVPAFRDLSSGSSDGADVRQLEENLVLLGFDPDGAITIDETYDDATADAVTAWEDSLGLEGDGKVPQSQIVFVPGRLLVDTVPATVGGRLAAGAVLFTGRQTARTHLVAATVAGGGVLDEFAAVGTDVTTGTVLFHVGDVPVVAITGDPAALPALTRDLAVGVDDGADVKRLEQLLVAAGADPDATMTVDDHFDDATAAAAERWQRSLGMVTSDDAVTVPAGSFVVVPAGLQAGPPLVAAGTSLMADAVVLALTAPAREVTTTAPIDDTTFALGATIDVEFPDGTVQPGTVVDVGTVATNTSGQPGSTPSVTITIHVDDIPASVDDFVQIPVTLRVVSESAPGAFVVPVSALVALAEGGYAVEVVDGTRPDGTNATHLIGVTPGLFADGFVAVTGDQLADGLTVVVPG